METDSDLTTLIKRNDHLNVLRFIRVHQLREPSTVLTHGLKLLDSRRLNPDELTRLAVLEQVCLAALDVGEPEIAADCILKIKKAGIPDDSVRFKRLSARCLEAAGDLDGADLIYDELLKENPSNLMALKRKYCLLKAQPGKTVEACEALNKYLHQNYSDTAAWHELSSLRMEMGDFEGAAFALEEVIIGTPSDASLHLQLAECYATIGKLENLLLARKHCAQALELDPGMRRALFSLVSISNAYLLEASKGKGADEHEVAVAQELVKFGAKRLVEAYAGTELFARTRDLMLEYEEGL